MSKENVLTGKQLGMRTWRSRRARTDVSLLQISTFTRLKEKVINILRRVSIFFIALLFRKYSNAQPPTLESIRSILIIPNDPIGDLLLTSPLWKLLLDRKPSLRIGVGISSRNAELVPYIPQVLCCYDLHTTNIIGLLHSLMKARKDTYDVVLTTAGYYRPTRFACISRIIAKSGFTATMHTSRANRYAQIYSWCKPRMVDPFPQPMVEQYQDMVEQIFGIEFADHERIPTLDFRETRPSRQKYIHLNLEAKVSQREFGIPNSLELIRSIHERYPSITTLVTASKQYWYEYGDQFENVRGCQRYDTHTLEELIDVIRGAELVISPDTAVVHIAAALGRPIVAMYPLRDEWLPYGVEAAILTPERGKPVSTIPLDAVLDAVIERLHVHE